MPEKISFKSIVYLIISATYDYNISHFFASKNTKLPPTVGMGIYGSTLLPSTLLRDSERSRTVTILSLSKDPIPSEAKCLAYET
jgi:hypothetical protein